jgi:hypothetical protein
VNNFAVIEKLEDFSFEKVQYYSIRFEEKEVNEFFDFLNRMEDVPEIQSDVSNLLLWIETIGEQYGAIRDRFFRHEAKYGEASALPPPAGQMETLAIVIEEDLRLYCMVANEHVVFLFNGGIKTEKYPEDCPNVRLYFKQANALAYKIDELFRDRSLRWNEEYSDILFEQDLIIEL